MIYELENKNLVPVRKITVKKKEHIYRDGSTAHGFYHVKSGLIGLYRITENGKESLMRIYGPGSYFGYRSLFSKQKYPATARGMVNSTLLKVDINSFNELEDAAPELASYLMREVCEELGEAEERLMQKTSYSSKRRILDAICHLFASYPTYNWTHREIGEYSGTDTTTVIRFCKILKEKGYLRKTSRKPIPEDMDRLTKYGQSVC